MNDRVAENLNISHFPLKLNKKTYKSLGGSENSRLLYTSWLARCLTIILITLKRWQLLNRKVNSCVQSHTRYLGKHWVRTQRLLLRSSAITYVTHTAYCSSPLSSASHLPADTSLNPSCDITYLQASHRAPTSTSSPTELLGSLAHSSKIVVVIISQCWFYSPLPALLKI